MFSQSYTSRDNSPIKSDDIASQDYGLHPLQEPLSSLEGNSEYPADIVFVHGLNGHWKRTWTHKRSQIFWPKDLLQGALPGVRVYSYGYPAAIFWDKSVATLHDIAKHLLDDVKRVRTQKVSPRNW